MRPLLAYMTTACDPLTGLARRVAVERAAVTELLEHPVRSSIWMAAVIRPFVQALPTGDPWRSVTVQLPDGHTSPGPSILTSSGKLASLPFSPGALAGNRPFGTVEDHLDLNPRGAEDLDDDLALAGVNGVLPLPASYLISAAGWGSFADLAAACLRVAALSPDDGGFTVPAEWQDAVGIRAGEDGGFHVMSEALRRVLFRYRNYVGDAGVTAEAPQLAYEVDFWVNQLRPAKAQSEDAVRAAVAAAGQPPILRSMPIPDDAYASFRLT